MNNGTVSPLLCRSATLLLAGQILYVLVTLLRTGGPANDHPVIFATYAGSSSWAAVHVAQFACMALLIAGLLALAFALDHEGGTESLVGRLGAASAVVALALEGALQAVDGVANEQAEEHRRCPGQGRGDPLGTAAGCAGWSRWCLEA